MKRGVLKSLYKRFLTSITDTQPASSTNSDGMFQHLDLKAAEAKMISRLSLRTRREESIYRHRYFWTNCIELNTDYPTLCVLDCHQAPLGFAPVYTRDDPAAAAVSFTAECALDDGTPVQVILLTLLSRIDIFSIDGKTQLSSFKFERHSSIWIMCPGKGVVVLGATERDTKVALLVSLADGSVTELPDTSGGFPFATYFEPGVPHTGYDNVLFYDQTVHGPVAALRIGHGLRARDDILFTWTAYNAPHTITVNSDFLVFREKMADEQQQERWVLIDRRTKGFHQFTVHKPSRFSSSWIQHINSRIFMHGVETVLKVFLVTTQGPLLVAVWRLPRSDAKAFVPGTLGRWLVVADDETYVLYDFIAAGLR